MKHQRVRNFAKPVSVARKTDTAVEKAAVFVEKLFDRPLKSDPAVLIIKDDNRQEILDVLSEYPNAISIRLLWFLKSSNLDDREQIWGLMDKYPEGDFSRLRFVEFTPPELMSPKKLFEKALDAKVGISLRAVIEHLSRIDDPTFLQKVARAFVSGVYFHGLDLIVLTENGGPKILVHELIHAEDRADHGTKLGRFNLMVSEGRAKYGEKFFEAFDAEDSFPISYMKSTSMFTYLKPFSKSPGAVVNWVKHDGALDFLKWANAVYQLTIGLTGLNYQLVYLPFAVQLLELTIAVEDPCLAFQIATKKPPEKFAHVLKPLDYYAPEIAKHKPTS